MEVVLRVCRVEEELEWEDSAAVKKVAVNATVKYLSNQWEARNWDRCSRHDW